LVEDQQIIARELVIQVVSVCKLQETGRDDLDGFAMPKVRVNDFEIADEDLATDLGHSEQG